MISLTFTCSKCEYRQKPPLNGPCACLADPQKRDILVMVTLPNAELPKKCPLPIERNKASVMPIIGTSPEIEQRRAKSGGCCHSSKSDEYPKD